MDISIHIRLSLSGNQLSTIESGVFSGLPNLERLYLSHDIAMTQLNLADATLSRLVEFSVDRNVNITSVSLRNTVLNQTSLAVLLDGGTTDDPWIPPPVGIGELDGITEIDLSGIDFVNITDLEPLYVMDDLTDLWLADPLNLDASDLDVLLGNLATIEGARIEGILHITRADFDAFNIAGGGLLAAWDAEPGHHVAFVIPEPSTVLLALVALCGVGGWRKWGG